MALVVKANWAKLLLNGSKTLELRGRQTKRTGRIAIAVSGTGQLHGTIELVGCRLLDRSCLRDLYEQHRVADLTVIKYSKVWGWQVKNPVVFKTPRAFAHPRGAVTWVRLAAKQTKSGSLRGAGEQEPASSASSLSSDDSRSSSTSASSASSPDDARSLRHTSKQEPASRRRSNHLATSLAGEI